MMKTITTFLSGLLLSVALLLSTSAFAAELQPFFTLKLSGVNSLVSVAEKIGSMAGFSDSAEFREVLAHAKGLQGINPNEIVGVAAVAIDNEISPILLLPITDLKSAEIPGLPHIFDTLRSLLGKKTGDRTNIDTPLGTYVAIQKQGYLVIVPESIVDQVPADPKKLFAELEKYTLGIKFDCEKIDFDLIEANVFGPLVMVMSMQNPEAGEQFENVVEIYRQVFKEFSTIAGGIAFNPRTADIEFSGTMVPRKGSDFAKSLAGYKQQPTMFSGFRGTPGNIILSFGDSATQPPLPNQRALLEPSLKQWETIIEGLLEQVEMENETGEASKIAKEIIGSIQKIIDIETKRGVTDSALSLNTDGTLLFAFDTGSLAEIRKLTAMIVDFAGQKVGPFASAFEIDIKASVNREYTTVEGFKLSSFKFPMDKVVPLIPDPDAEKTLKSLSPGVFWAVKDAGNKQAIAVAVGLDFAKTESAFKSALEQTKTSAPVQKPVGTISIQGLGKFLQQTVYPIAEKGGAPDLANAKKAFDILAAAGNDATITINVDMMSDRIEGGYFISGKAIQAVISVVKIAMESSIPAIQDF